MITEITERQLQQCIKVGISLDFTVTDGKFEDDDCNELTDKNTSEYIKTLTSTKANTK